ncbi:MAG: CotH kinase family protein [Calditrichia bacterium]
MEIARANIGVKGTPPAYDQLAFQEHEAHMYQGLPPEKFALEDIQNILHAGENVLAIEVHNVQLYSSDMSLIPFLTLEMSAIPPNARGPEPLLNLPEPQLHTSFKISASGETLVLSDSTGNVIDELVAGFIPADYSYGRKPDGDSTWYFFAQSTPGEPNNTEGFIKFTDPPAVSIPGGFYSSPATVELSSNDPSLEIHYTLDGSVPTDTSLLYTDPITIDTTAVLRANTCGPGYMPGKTVTHTYFIQDKFSIPVVSLSANPADFFDWNTGLYVDGPNATTDYPYFGANFWNDWEKPLHVEMYEPDGTPGFSVDAGVKIYGSWSRLYPQKSVAIFARDRYGDSEIDYQIFPNIPIDQFQAFVLRNSGQDWGHTFFRDGMLHTLVNQMGIDVQGYRPAMVFINGQLWGIHNMREKLNEQYLASHYGVDPNNIDLVERDTIIVAGDNVKYHELINFVETNDLSLTENVNKVKEWMDVGNFKNYTIAVLFMANSDWPWNNVKCWRERSPEGRFRWMLYDLDYCFHGGHLGPEANTFNELASQNTGTTTLFFKLLENKQYRQEFINRYADHLNTTFDSTRVLGFLDWAQQGIEAAMPYHIQRWQGTFSGPWWLGKSIDNMDEWYASIEVAKDFARRRPDYVRQHIMEQFGLQDGGVATLHINVSPPEAGAIKINTITPDHYPWSGQYFPNVPVKLTALPNTGYHFAGWKEVHDSSRAISTSFKDGQQFTALFVEDSSRTSMVVINEINYNDADDFKTEDWVELYNTTGLSLDISGWRFSDEDDAHNFILPTNTVMPPDGYLILCRDSSAFKKYYPLKTNLIGDFDFGLSSAGELVRLFDVQGIIVDSLTFGSTSPWPTEADGTGATLSLLNPELDNSLPANWTASAGHGTPGEINDVYITRTDENEVTVPQKFELYQNYPNPFNPTTMIRFTLPETVPVSISVYDITGREVARLVDGRIQPGMHSLQFDGSHLASGIYMIRMNAGRFTKTKKMMLIR